MMDQDGTKWIDEYYDEGYMLLKDRPSNLQKTSGSKRNLSGLCLRKTF